MTVTNELSNPLGIRDLARSFWNVPYDKLIPFAKGMLESKSLTDKEKEYLKKELDKAIVERAK